MPYDTPETSTHREMPFGHTKIPVCRSLREFKTFIDTYPDATICPYIADKTDDAWDISTSRVYMNQTLHNFLYVPVNIPKGDERELQEFLDAVKDDTRIAAVNITQPHKSSPVLQRIFFGDEKTDQAIDTLIRSNGGALQPFDLNAPSFVSWYKDEVGEFADKDIVLVGIGGVGEPIAKMIAAELPNRLVLIDSTDKTQLATRLQANVDATYAPTLGEVSENFTQEIVLINAAGKEGVHNNTNIDAFLQSQSQKGGTFVDIRPQLKIDVVERAKKFGWHAFTGYGMNARNDYTLLRGIADYMKVEPEPFTKFQARVAKAS